MKKGGIILIFLVSMLVNIYYGYQKSGFHEDEYYTYFSSNRSLGLYQPDREWQDRQTILDEFSVKEGEAFNYGLVKLVQSWDVHPPLYYWIFHSICSLTLGVFSKWSGIITNLLAFTIGFWLLYMIMTQLSVYWPVTAIALLFWGINPQTISCNMLIRMYAWLTVAIFACAYLHIRLIKEGFCRKYMIFLMLVSYLGFLTQYFYLFFFVCTGFVYTFWLVFMKKEIKSGIIYVICCAASLGLAVITYPACLSHLFGGYRGQGAAESLFDLGNTFMRISFFTGLLNDFVFAGLFVVVALVLVAGLLVKRFKPRADIVIITIGTIGYFLLTSKAALLVGSASNRYEMPIYGLVIAMVFVGLQSILYRGDSRRRCRNAAIIMALCSAVILIKGHFVDRNILFLYPEDVAKISYALDNHNEVAVVMFNPSTPHNVWRLTDELLEYPEVYYMDEENCEPVTEKKLLESSKIVLYIADDDNQEQAIANLKASTSLMNLQEISTEDMWTTYELR